MIFRKNCQDRHRGQATDLGQARRRSAVWWRQRAVLFLLLTCLAGQNISCTADSHATWQTAPAALPTLSITKIPTPPSESTIQKSASETSSILESNAVTSVSGTAATEPAAPTWPTDPAELIGRMTIEEKVGQLLIFGYDDIDDAESVVRDLHPGGVVLFGSNIRTPAQTRTDIDALQAAALQGEGADIPLFVAVDQEGGRVSRLPAEAGIFESARQVGSRNDLAYTQAFGEKTGHALRDLGFNVDFAPVLDIDSNPLNPVIGDRSYGMTADFVTGQGLAMMTGLELAGVIACVKHFPGHGDTQVDSHVSLPVVGKSLEELRNFELIPFTAAIDHQVSMIMVAHLLVEKLDNRPASLSPVLVDGLLRGSTLRGSTLRGNTLHGNTLPGNTLRGSTGFNGVVITDDLTMGAITENYSLAEAAIMAVEAGCDLLAVCHGTDRVREVYAALLEAWQAGRLTTQRLDLSVGRILLLKQKRLA